MQNIKQNEYEIFDKLTDCTRIYSDDDIGLNYIDLLSILQQGDYLSFAHMYSKQDISYEQIMTQILEKEGAKLFQYAQGAIVRILCPANKWSLIDIQAVNDLIWDNIPDSLEQSAWCAKISGEQVGIEIFVFKKQAKTYKD